MVQINASHFAIRNTFKKTCDSKKLKKQKKLRYKKFVGKIKLIGIKIIANASKCVIQVWE